ncbi:MAG TPA: transporter, partial [Pyrinomonadaceae bacterium]|nr:transporter [Pyrinomonadaceae bacterium]
PDAALLSETLDRDQSGVRPPHSKETPKRIILFAAVVIVAGLHSNVRAQDLDPRAYSRSPVGTNFIVFAYGHQSGDVLVDSTLPLTDVQVKLNSMSFGYGRTFGLAGRQANASLVMPYVRGTVKGTVFETQTQVSRSGMADLRARFSLNLIGSPAMSPKEFATTKTKTLLGASVTVVAPNGQYDPNRLVNLGSNRWSVKPEVGLSHPLGRWTFEFNGGVWFFTENKNFFGGVRRRQKPIASLQGHVIYTVRPRMWIAFDSTYFQGGRTITNGLLNSDLQKNSRIGATFSLPLTQHHSLKFLAAKGLTTRIGSDLTLFSVAWQYSWFSKQK